MTLFILVLLGIFFLIGAILSIIFTVITFAGNQRSRYGWLSGMLGCLIGLICCLFFGVRIAAEKVGHFVNDIKEQVEKSEPMEEGTHDRRIYLFDSTGNAQLNTIRSYLPDSLQETVPSDFFIYFGNQWLTPYYRLPLPYPYAIHCMRNLGNGVLYNERGVLDFEKRTNNGTSLNIQGISKIAYDGRFLLIEQEHLAGQSPGYLLFTFDKEEAQPFASGEELLQAARHKGYSGPDTLMTLEQYNALF